LPVSPPPVEPSPEPPPPVSDVVASVPVPLSCLGVPDESSELPQPTRRGTLDPSTNANRRKVCLTIPAPFVVAAIQLRLDESSHPIPLQLPFATDHCSLFERQNCKCEGASCARESRSAAHCARCHRYVLASPTARIDAQRARIGASISLAAGARILHACRHRRVDFVKDASLEPGPRHPRHGGAGTRRRRTLPKCRPAQWTLCPGRAGLHGTGFMVCAITSSSRRQHDPLDGRSSMCPRQGR
jgi:hypothetical protein